MRKSQTRALLKTISWRTYLWIGLFVLAFYATVNILQRVNPLQDTSDTEIAAITPMQEKPQESAFLAPKQLEILSINVNSNIVPVGLTDSGDMAVNDNPNELFWYLFGPKPGEKGSAVIAGHYGWKDGQPAVFNDLHKLKQGDRLSVYDEAGVSVTFIVRESRRYDPEADATEVFKSNDGKTHLNLITCDGSWNNALQTYSQRLVVFTDKEMES